MTKPFEINFLDHVAIYVADVEVSIVWYQEALGLKKHQFEAWGAFPIFMLTGKTGVAIFPANAKRESMAKSVRIDHFAFNVSNKNFQKAQQHLTNLGIGFRFEDHTYFQSIYMKDPDNHTVELTTLVVPEQTVYE